MRYLVNNKVISKEEFMLKLKFQLLIAGYEHNEHMNVIRGWGFNKNHKLNDQVFRIEKL